VCTPPAGTAARGDVRATIGRLAHEPFTDEQVGELLEGAQQRDDIEADAVRVARRDLDKTSRVPGELVAEIARTAAAAPVARQRSRRLLKVCSAVRRVWCCAAWSGG
jgi:carboxypeptidase Taq